MQAIIPVDTQASDILSCAGSIPNMLYIPDDMTSTEVTFLISEGTEKPFRRLGDGAGGAYTVIFAAGDAVPLEPAKFASVQFFQIIAGDTEEDTDKTIGIGFIPR